MSYLDVAVCSDGMKHERGAAVALPAFEIGDGVSRSLGPISRGRVRSRRFDLATQFLKAQLRVIPCRIWISSFGSAFVKTCARRPQLIGLFGDPVGDLDLWIRHREIGGRPDS